MTFAEKYPDPGPMPPDPGPDPGMRDKDSWRIWNESAHQYNRMLMKVRKHRIALAVDKLSARNAMQDGLEAADSICLTVGVMVLEDTFKQHDPLNPLAAIFGGIF
jgi:hypothetical protein